MCNKEAKRLLNPIVDLPDARVQLDESYWETSSVIGVEPITRTELVVMTMMMMVMIMIMMMIMMIIIIIIRYLLTRRRNNTSACYKASTETNTTQKQYKYTKMKTNYCNNSIQCEFLGFRCGAVDVSVFLGYSAMSLGDWCLTFRYSGRIFNEEFRGRKETSVIYSVRAP